MTPTIARSIPKEAPSYKARLHSNVLADGVMTSPPELIGLFKRLPAVRLQQTRPALWTVCSAQKYETS